MDKSQIIKEIQSFLEGHDTEHKYIVNVEVDKTTNKAACVVHEPGQEKRINYIKYTPFLYIKDLKTNGIKLYGGDKDYTIAKMKKHGIRMEKMKTGNQPRLEDGYIWKITSSQSYQSIFDFFKEGGIDPYEKWTNPETGEKEYKYRKFFYMVKLDDQFFISTGIRLFKGIEEYKDVHRLTFDIETTGLRYQISRIFAIGVKDNRGFEKVLEVKKVNDDEAEMRLIQDFFNLVNILKPAVISGYNSENFDFDFILGRCQMFNKDKKRFDLSKVPTTLLDKRNILRRPNQSVKFGNSADKYTATKMWGYSVIDILHAVKRTVAVNTEIKNNKLKYICKYENIAKPNRMYIDGSDGNIGRYYVKNPMFIINIENNNYVEIPEKYNLPASRLYKIQEGKKRGELSDEKYIAFKRKILGDEKNFINWLKKNGEKLGSYSFTTGKNILKRYLLDDLWETEQVDELYNQSTFLLSKIVPTTFHRSATMGNAAVWNLLMTTWSYENDLAIPDSDIIENFSGGLTRCYKKGYSKKVAKIDYASLYPMIQLTHDVFPVFDITGVIKKMLLYLTTTRNIYKKLAKGKSLNPEETELLLSTGQEDTYKKLKNGKEFTKIEQNMYGVKQLPIKILNNSLFGALGSGIAFNWSDNICAARITCTGRLELRHAISWFKQFDCIALLAVTDGVNFQIPEKTKIKITDDGVIWDSGEELPIEEAWKYNGEVGLAAIIEKFNKEEMKPPFMSVDNDGEYISCLNLSRINYAKLKEVDGKRKIELTGNTIKSKVMPEYIEEFIDNGLLMILEGKGGEFVEYYYDYLSDIYHQTIPLKKIATKKKYKTTIQNYLNRGTDKNGKDKAKQAHMELIIMEREGIAKKIYKEHFEGKQIGDSEKIHKPVEEAELSYILNVVDDHMPPEPELDSYVYYVNIGTAKSHGDSQWIKDPDDPTGEKLMFCSKLIDSKQLEDNPELTGSYNVSKYIDAFNKRVKTILEGFSIVVRKQLLVKDPEYREHFTKEELKLKNFDHDKYDESMFLEDKEIEFWNKTGYNPKLVWDGFKQNSEHYLMDSYEFVREHLSKQMEKAGKGKLLSVNDPLEKGRYILYKNYDNYSIGYYNGEYVQIIRRKIENLPLSPMEKELKEKEDKINVRKLEENKKKQDEEKVKAIETEKDKRAEHFINFKRKFKLPDNFTFDQLGKINGGSQAFENYIAELESINSPDDYVDVDDGDM